MARLQTAKKAAHAPSQAKQKSIRAKEGKKKESNEIKPESSKSNGKSSVKPENQPSSFREEILALGGDDEDYKLLKDVDSDEDVLMAGSSIRDAALSKDLAKVMKGLDFPSVKPAQEEGESDADESAEEEEGSEEEEDRLPEATSDAPEQKPEKKEEKQNITIPKVGPNPKLLLEPTPQWYTSLPPLPPSKTAPAPPSPQALSSKQAHAAELHAAELSVYERATSANKLTASSSDAAFLQRVLSSGTLSDRLSALTLMAQSSPVHNTRALETLRGMGQKKGREESLKALRAVCDWWVGGGAPNGKLKYFIDQPLNHPAVSDKHLLVWYFEDWLKKYFYSILQILETLSLDPLPYVRLQAMALIFTLLREKPEQEQNLLRLLVNKLGDSERPVASRASYHLLQLLQAHPSMKAVMVREISSLVLRPARSDAAATTTHSGATHLKFTDDAKTAPKVQAKPQDKTEKKDLQQEHSKYYAAITLNQIMLAPTEADRAVAVQLVSLYFELFKEILGTPAKPLDSVSGKAGDEVDHSRYAKERRKKQEQRKGKGKDKEEHEGGFAEVEDSNSRLTSAILTGVNRALPFAKLGLEDVEFSKHIDTLFLISHKSTFNISLQALRLIMQICQSLTSTSSASTSSSSLSTSISDRYYRTLYTSLHDTRLNSSSKHAMYLNLVLKSLKMDTKVDRVKAFVRRFVQLLVGSGSGGAEFVAGGLYLLGELFKAQPAMRDLLGKHKQTSTSDEESANVYDPKKRDPQYANAGACPMWELLPLLSHYHPTVRLHASQLLSGKELSANADLSLNTLSHFLDRFVYKNPRRLKPKGSSAMQPGASAQDGTSIRVIKGAQADGGGMVNDEVFWRKDVKDVPVDQIFFHKFFSKKSEKERAKAEKAAKRKGGGGDSEDDGEDDAMQAAQAKSTNNPAEEDEDEDESEGEAEIWKAMKATNPDLRPDAGDDISEHDFDDDDELSLGSDDSGSDASAKEHADDVEVEDGDIDIDEDGLSLAEGSDAEDLIDLDDVELPDGLIEFNSDLDDGDAEADADVEWGGLGDADGSAKKRKRDDREGDTKQKKRRRALPTFATYEDYTKLIEGQPEDDI